MKIEEIIDERPVLYVLVGLPGSGKSTWCAKHAKDMIVISTDEHIERAAKAQDKTYAEVFPSEIDNAVGRILDMRRYAISGNKSFVWDQTNLTAQKRINIIEYVPSNYKKVAVVFEISPEELNDRLTARKSSGKIIPSNILQAMIDSYVPPTKEEGFDEIIQG